MNSLPKLFRDGTGVALVRLAGMGFGLLVTVIIGRILGAEGLGIYSYAVILLSLLAVPVSNGWATLTLRTVSRAKYDQQWQLSKGLMQRGAHLSVVLSVLGFALGMFVYRFFLESSEFLSVTAVALLAFVLFFDQLSALRLAVLRGLQHPVWGQAPEMLVRPLLITVCLLVIASMIGPKMSVQDAFWALLVASGITTFLGGMILWSKAPGELAVAPAIFDSRTWMASAGLLAGNAGLIMLNSQVDILLLGMLGSLEDVGVYRVAAQIALLSGFVYTALNMLAMQRFAYLRATGDIKHLRATATVMARIAFLGTFPLPVAFYFFGEKILLSLFGVEFVPALQPLFWLLAVQTISASAGMTSAILIMNGREALIIRLTIISLVVNVVLCLFLIPRFGTTGAAISTLLSIGGWNIALWAVTRKQLHIDSSILCLPVGSGKPFNVDSSQ